MTFFELNTLGDVHNRDYAFISQHPQGFPGMKRYRFTTGDTLTEFWSDGMKVQLEEEYPGIKLTSILGNTWSVLIAHRDLVSLIQKFSPNAAIEYLPFELFDHRGRPYSKDYFFVNPTVGYDCLDDKASGTTYDEDGEPEGIERLVLDVNKLDGAPAIFRVKQEMGSWLVRGDLAEAMRSGKFTNVLLTERPISGK